MGDAYLAFTSLDACLGSLGSPSKRFISRSLQLGVRRRCKSGKLYASWCDCRKADSERACTLHNLSNVLSNIDGRAASESQIWSGSHVRRGREGPSRALKRVGTSPPWQPSTHKSCASHPPSLCIQLPTHLRESGTSIHELPNGMLW